MFFENNIYHKLLPSFRYGSLVENYIILLHKAGFGDRVMFAKKYHPNCQHCSEVPEHVQNKSLLMERSSS